MSKRSSFSTLSGVEAELKQPSQRPFPRNLLQHYPLVSFFILAYTIGWSGDIAEAFLPLSWFPTFLIDFLVNWAPGIAALLVIAVLQGKDGMRNLLRPLFHWRVHPGWYFLVIGLAPLVVLTAIGLGVLFGGPVPVFGQALTSHLALLPVLLFFNAGEEVGWRGFALPRLQSRFTPLIASLILGAIWGFWHAPTYVLSGRSLLLLIFLPSVMAQTILLTWIYNRSGGNLLLVTLFHWSWDSMLEVIAPAWLPPAGVASMFVISTIIIILLAVIVATRINRRPFHGALSK